MQSFAQQYELWDEFLRVWPRERLAHMTLDEYTQAGSKETFTYWIEARLEDMGSIWGGSAFKFGVFSRKDAEAKESDGKLSYSSAHGWYSSLGASAEEAFGKVRRCIGEIADLARQGHLDGIEKNRVLGDVFKWKIAFHYQDRQAPTIIDVFKQGWLRAFAGVEAGERSVAALHRAALARRPADLGILEFGREIWAEWSETNLVVWKLSHGDQAFSNTERQRLLQECLAVVHGQTGVDQGKNFAEAPIGALFYLCHGNSPQRVGQFTSPAVPSTKGDGWLQRSYRALRSAVKSDAYEANSKKWSPRGNSTFWQVGADDLPEFDSTLLAPYFSTSLAELAGAAGEPIEAAPVSVVDTGLLTDESLLRHFDSKPTFKTFRASWSEQDKALFCRLVCTVHAAGLDWWHVGTGIQVRFGRKSPGNERAAGVLGIVRGLRARKVFWRLNLGAIKKGENTPLRKV